MNAIENARKRHRKAIELLYDDLCTVYEYQKIKDDLTKITGNKETAVLENQPCKISFDSIKATSQNDGAAEQDIDIKLFISPDVEIKPGSKIVVKHLGQETAYSNSGTPGKPTTHQEIKLKLFERWA